MSTIGKRTIYVGAAGENNSKPMTVEGVAVAAHLPGTLLKQTASGLEAQDATATDRAALPLFADKDSMRQKSVDDAWVINENMAAVLGRSGDILNVLVATGQTLAIGDALVSNGAGLLIKATDTVDDGTDGSQYPIAFADEAVTTTATQLVRVRIA